LAVAPIGHRKFLPREENIAALARETFPSASRAASAKEIYGIRLIGSRHFEPRLTRRGKLREAIQIPSTPREKS
jgi:hypothetical protein